MYWKPIWPALKSAFSFWLSLKYQVHAKRKKQTNNKKKNPVWLRFSLWKATLYHYHLSQRQLQYFIQVLNSQRQHKCMKLLPYSSSFISLISIKMSWIFQRAFVSKKNKKCFGLILYPHAFKDVYICKRAPQFAINKVPRVVRTTLNLLPVMENEENENASLSLSLSRQ